jgi:hypothetical protein
MVVIISTLITFSGFLTTGVTANLTADIIQSQNTKINQYIIVGGKKYRIILEEVTKI